METETLGRYRLLSLLATGGMGEVFLARQEGPAGFSKSVVIKRILRHLASDQGFIEMFKNEARLAAQLQHPNVAQVFELGHDEPSDTWFIAMEFVHGRSLRACIEQALARGVRCPPRVAARVVADALRGLGFAHTLTDERGKPLGILHRDVSPDNVLVGFSGVAKLVDFGIAKATGATSVTRTGALKGKFSYMAPEQFEANGRIDARTDLYAAGVLLHELLVNGRPACVPKNSEEALGPRAPWTPREDLPPALNDILRKALAPSQDARWSSAEDMAHALDEFVQAGGGPVTPTHVAEWMRGLFGEEVAAANPAVAPSTPFSTAVISGPVAPPPDARAAEALAAAPTQIDSSFQVAAPPRAGIGLTATPAGAERPTRPERKSRGHSGESSVPAPPSRAPLVATVVASMVIGLAVGLIVLLPVLSRDGDVAPPAQSQPPVAAVAPPPEVPPPPPIAAPPPPPPPEAALDLDAGVTLLPELDLAAASPVRPAPSRGVRKKAPPRPGRVSVRANPWAEVFYGGRSYGITPPAVFVDVPAGTAQFTLKNKQLGVTKKVSVKGPPGGEVVLKADLFRK